MKKTSCRIAARAGRALLRTAAAVALATCALTLGPRAFAQRGQTPIPDPDPQQQLGALKPAEGFQINLFASDPQIAKPIHMNFDAAGRLWVASSSLYPQIGPGVERTDRVFVLEDTDGDGRADKSTVFADNLLLPTGIVPDDTVPHLAAYVANSSEILYLEDTNGDHVADRSKVVLSGFGTEDTHHIVHTFRWGPGGHLYFNQSIYTHSHIETPWGVRRLNAGGVWKFDPDTQRLDVFTRGGINLWGHHMDRFGQSFLTDGAFTEGINYAFPGATFATAAGAERLVRGLNPGQPKLAGLEIVSGRHLPDSWQGRFLSNDFRGNRTYAFRVEDSGSGFMSRQAEDLVTTTHVAYRPVDVKMGPDGAIYIADWYNPIIQHGEVDFRDPRRDKLHGRIWRVTAVGRPLVPRPRLELASIPELLAALAAPEQFTREHARPVLARRGAAAVLPALRTWVAGLNRSDPSQAQLLLEALWVCQWLDTPEPALLEQALTSQDPRVRAGALRTAADWSSRLPNALALFDRAVTDPHPRVRLEALSGLGTLGTAEAARAAIRAADQPTDTNIEFALWQTLRATSSAWLPRVDADLNFFGPNRARLISALAAANRPEAVRPLVALWRTGAIAAADQAAAVKLMATAGGPAELRLLFDLALDPGTGGSRAAMLEALERAVAERRVRPTGSLTSLTSLLGSGDESSRAAALRLAGLWQIAEAQPSMVDAARSENAVLRSAAVQALSDLGSASQPILAELAASGSLARRVEALGALTKVDIAAAAGVAVGMLELPDVDSSAIATAFLARQNGPQALTTALAGRTVAPAAARALLRSIASAGRPLPELTKAVETAGRLEPVVKMPEGPALAALMAAVRTSGSADRGEEIYRRPGLACIACHAIGGGGGRVGPDLLSLGASAPLNYIIQALLDPQASIKEGYEITNVTRADGTITAGVLLRETDTELLLRDAGNAEHRVPTSQVRSRSRAAISLMPPGLTAGLREDELVDLIAFLSALGREKSVPAERYVRRYALLEGGAALTGVLRGRGTSWAAANPNEPGLPWHTVYARVDGSMPTEIIPRGSTNISSDGSQYRMARFDLEVQRAGAVALEFNNPLGVMVYAGGQRIPDVKQTTTFNLPAGRHTISLLVYSSDYGSAENNRPRDMPLRIRLADAPANAAQVQLVDTD